MNSPLRFARYVLLLCIALSARAELSAQSTCEIWQWTGTDSANKILAKTDTYNEKGLLVHEHNAGFLHDPYVYGGVDVDYISRYSDTLLTTWIVAIPNGDSMRHENKYDPAGRRVKEFMFRYRHMPQNPQVSCSFNLPIVREFSKRK